MSVTNPTNRSIPKRAVRLFCSVVIDGTLGATCGGLFGLAFGGFGALIHGEAWKLISIAVYYAGWGFSAGAIVGAYGALFHADGNSVGPTIPSPKFLEQNKSPVESVRQFKDSLQNPVQPVPTLAARADCNRTQTVGA